MNGVAEKRTLGAWHFDCMFVSLKSKGVKKMKTFNASNLHMRTVPRTVCLASFIAVLTLALTGCGDEQTIIESVENVRAPDGVLSREGPKFCFDQRPPAEFACRLSTACIEYLPDAEIPIAALRAECNEDGGQLVTHCAVEDNTVLGACVENDLLRISYSDANISKTDCEFDAYEWISCPVSDAP